MSSSRALVVNVRQGCGSNPGSCNHRPSTLSTDLSNYSLGSEEFSLESVSWWISANLDSVVRQLNDDNFEHLVQAATGSTTGDWVIWL